MNEVDAKFSMWTVQCSCGLLVSNEASSDDLSFRWINDVVRWTLQTVCFYYSDRFSIDKSFYSAHAKATNFYLIHWNTFTQSSSREQIKFTKEIRYFLYTINRYSSAELSSKYKKHMCWVVLWSIGHRSIYRM